VVAGNLSGGPVSLDPIFPQGSSSEAGSTASIYLPPVGSDDLYASLPPRSKDLWADGTIQVVFDLAEARIQILTYASGEGWVQDGDDIPAEFVEGDRYRVSMDESGMLEISRNGEVVTTREMAPKTSLQQPGGFKLASYPLNVLAAPKTSTPTRTPTATLTPSQTATLTNTATATVTNTPIDTATFTLTVPPTETMTEIPTGIPTFTSTPVLPTATLPPVPSGPLTIDYIYDALNRLTSATYSDGRSFGYTYDEAGNVLELEKNLGPGTVVTTYTYDTANQLDTATENGVTWQYHYDANGSLIETLPDGAAGSGAKRYTYNVAGYLTQVELHNGSDWQTQTEMDYNGLGQRLSMDAAGVIAHYVMDGNQPLTATAGTNTSFYLYGLGPIGEKTDAWSYSLPDGTNTPRQISNITADITLSARYTPWGDTLDTYGNGSFAFGYFGGVLDAATGLLYVGNGQYYDPETGRFLTRDAKPNNTNPYIPWDPTGAIIGPLGIAALFFTRRKKGSKVGTFLVLLLVLGSVGMTLAACSNVPAGRVTVTATLTPGAPVNYTATVDNGFTVTGTLPASSGAAIGIATSCATIPPTPSPTPTSTPTPYDILQIPYPGSPAYDHDSGAWNKTLQKYKELREWALSNAPNDLISSNDSDGYGYRFKDEVLLSIIISVEFITLRFDNIFDDVLGALNNQYMSPIFCNGNCDSVMKQLIWLSNKQGIRRESADWIGRWYPQMIYYGTKVKDGDYSGREGWEWGNFEVGSPFDINPGKYPNVAYTRFGNDDKYAGFVVFTVEQDINCGACLGWQ
jgi:RHS repeat-associated protein